MLFLELPCFFYDPADVGNLISGSFGSSKSSLYIGKFSVHVLLKSSLKEHEPDLASMWNVRLHKVQAEIKIAGKNTNNLKYVDNPTLMVESKEELKSLLIRVKEESEKALKNIQNRKSWHPVLSLYGK